MSKKDLIEKIAKIIFAYDGGMYPEEYEKCTGKKKDEWGSWETEHLTNEGYLTEWQRDDYRLQAKKVLEYLEEQGLWGQTIIN